MYIEFNLQRVSFSGDVMAPCIISYEKGSLNTSIHYVDQEFGKLIFNGEDLFSALEGVRRYLEDKGFLLLCAGSMPNTYPSRMSRQMSNGRKAYVHILGNKPNKSDIIDIFQPVGFEKVGTILEQNEFMNNWYNS